MNAVQDRLAEIEGRARENWPTSEDVATLAAALRAVLAVHHDGRFADEIAYDNPPYCLESETDEYPCTTLVALAAGLGVTL